MKTGKIFCLIAALAILAVPFGFGNSAKALALPYDGIEATILTSPARRSLNRCSAAPLTSRS